MNLCVPFPASTALSIFEVGDSQYPRLDSGKDDQDTGYRMTCVYFLGEDGDAKGGNLKLKNVDSPDKDFIEIPYQQDRLVIFHSQKVINMITEVTEGQRKILTFWIHGFKS